MKTIEELEAQLRLMRHDTTEYGRDRDHDTAELLKMKGECWTLWGAIECFKKGDTPVLPSQIKYLE